METKNASERKVFSLILVTVHEKPFAFCDIFHLNFFFFFNKEKFIVLLMDVVKNYVFLFLKELLLFELSKFSMKSSFDFCLDEGLNINCKM